MIRLFKNHAKFLLLMLIMWKQLDANRNGNAQRALVDQVAIWLRDNPTHPAAFWLLTFDWVDFTNHANVDEQIEVILEGLAGDTTNSRGDVSIISTIIEVLGLPWTGNRLGAEALGSLRKAILRPSEIAAFQKLAKESFQCANCSHKFMGSEAAIVHRGSNHELRVTCIRCTTPSYGACGACGESSALTEAGLAALMSTKFVSCGCGSKKKKEVESADSSTFRISTTTGRGPAAPPRPPAPATLGQLRRARAVINAFDIETPTATVPVQPLSGTSWALAEERFVGNNAAISAVMDDDE